MGYTINMTDKKVTKENIKRISTDLVETVDQLEYVVRNHYHKFKRTILIATVILYISIVAIAFISISSCIMICTTIFYSFIFNQLRIAVADHISEALIAAKVPLQVLIDTAMNKSNDELENYAQSFSDDAESILQVWFIAVAYV